MPGRRPGPAARPADGPPDLGADPGFSQEERGDLDATVDERLAQIPVQDATDEEDVLLGQG